MSADHVDGFSQRHSDIAFFEIPDGLGVPDVFYLLFALLVTLINSRGESMLPAPALVLGNGLKIQGLNVPGYDLLVDWLAQNGKSSMKATGQPISMVQRFIAILRIPTPHSSLHCVYRGPPEPTG